MSSSTPKNGSVIAAAVSAATAVDHEPPSRAALRRARRVCVKAGTSVVANENGRPSLTRLGAMCEQISELVNQQGVQVILVSSGAVGMGKRLLRKQSKMLMSLKDIHDDHSERGVDHHHTNGSVPARSQSFVSLLDAVERRPATSPLEKQKQYDSACASAGQFELMNLYSSLFAQCDITASQILVTQTDFTDEPRLKNLRYAIERLLSLGVVPILNENDAVSANRGYTDADVFSDNDSLAALCARSFGAEVLLLLTDVEGVYDRPPSEPGASLIPLYRDDQNVAIGAKSSQGRGGMAAKIDAAVAAVQPGSSCSACVVAAGSDLESVRGILGPAKKLLNKTKLRGTLFCTPGSDLEQQAVKDFYPEVSSQDSSADEGITTKAGSPSGQRDVGGRGEDNSADCGPRSMAMAARDEARRLQGLPHDVRRSMLRAMADALEDPEKQGVLLAANAMDIEAAERNGVAHALKKRLGLSVSKLSTLATGLRQIADAPDPLGVVKSKRELAKDLELSQITVPIGVVMVIFESRPDSMPQISSLALASGNGLLLKGGKEAVHSNAAIHKILGDAIEEGSKGQVKRDVIALVTTRSQIADLLSLDDVIELIIPRGSNSLVSHIKANTKIPVLGHADGVCHVYVDSSAGQDAACRIVVDAKTDYPSACNAMETLLLHADTIDNGVAAATLMALRAAGVKCLGGPTAMRVGLCDTAAPELKHEYGDLTCTVEVIENVDAAIDWIHKYGSGHTESIVCRSANDPVAKDFLQRVDAACVFVNASTRFADGYRFGLGAEVGISTGRIHSRGPVGVHGLLTTKWQLRAVPSTDDDGNSNGDQAIFHTVAEFSGDNATKTFTHRELM